MGRRFGQAEGVQVGVQMAAHAIGANQHQCPQGIEGRFADLGGTHAVLRRFLVAAAVVAAAALLGRGQVVGQGDDIAVAEDLLGPRRPTGPVLFLGESAGVVFQPLEEILPTQVYGAGVIHVAFIEFRDIDRIAGVEKLGRIEIDFRHAIRREPGAPSLIWGPRRVDPRRGLPLEHLHHRFAEGRR